MTRYGNIQSKCTVNKPWSRINRSISRPDTVISVCRRGRPFSTTYRQVGEGGTEVVAIFRVKTRVIYEIDAASDDVSRRKGGSVRLTGARRTERMAVVAVITIRLFVPTWQSVHVDALGGQTDAHVAVAPFADDLHLEVVEAARGGDGVRRLDARRISVRLAVTFVVNAQIVLGQSDVVVLFFGAPGARQRRLILVHGGIQSF
jgi:hypothetical protein